jgi:hypothetical protein
MDGAGSATSGPDLHGLPLYLVSRAAAASAAVLTTLLIGNRASALDHAIDVAFAIGYAAERWGLTSHVGQASTDVAEETA